MTPRTKAGADLLERETPVPPDWADPAEEWVADTWALRNELGAHVRAIEDEMLDKVAAAVEREHKRLRIHYGASADEQVMLPLSVVKDAIQRIREEASDGR